MRLFFRGQILGVATAVGLAIKANSAPPSTADEILKFSTEKMAAYQIWSADFTQTLVQRSHSLRRIHGRMIQKPSGPMWTEVEMLIMGQPSKMTMVLGDDKVLWKESTMAGQKPVVTKLDTAGLSSNVLVKARINPDLRETMDPSRKWREQEKFYDFTVEPSGMLSNQPTYVVLGSLEKSVQTNQQVMATLRPSPKMRFVIGQTDGFIYQYQLLDQSGTNAFLTMEFHDVKFNEPVLDATFVYHPPPNVIVTDLAKMIRERAAGPSPHAMPKAPAAAPAPPPNLAPAAPAQPTNSPSASAH